MPLTQNSFLYAAAIKHTTMIESILANKLQNRLKLLLRVIYYYCTVSLVLLYIYVYYGYVNGTLKINGEVKQNAKALHTHNISCSGNTFPTTNGCAPCINGTFGFSGWSECKPLLNCSDIALQLHRKERIFRGTVKEKWLADWKGHRVVYVNCSSARGKTQCLRGMTRMEQLQGPFVAHLIGRCYEKLEIVTAYYKHGSANNLNRLLQKPEFSQYNNIQTRFQLIVDYVKIINYLHNSPIGIRVMCDTASLRKLLMQYLITDDFHLIVNDLDNTPDAREENGILCSNKKELLEFVAPEQTWPFNESVPFRSDLKPTYDEKIDIWKIPPVVERILGDVNGSSFTKSKLQRVMERCQATDPQQRPTAKEVLQRLLRVQRLVRNIHFDP